MFKTMLSMIVQFNASLFFNFLEFSIRFSLFHINMSFFYFLFFFTQGKERKIRISDFRFMRRDLQLIELPIRNLWSFSSISYYI
jgi:hypothetical protein